MAIWYEGNRNKEINEREKNGITYYVRGTAIVDDKVYERYAVKTHFIERNENYIDIINQYIVPLMEKDDILSISEKVIAMCQGKTVAMDDVKLGFWAKFLSKFATKTDSGVSMDEPYKLQLTINMKGLPLVLWATFRAAIGKIFGKSGVFYEVVGKDIAGIDGFYQHSSFEIYHKLAVLIPENPDQVCDEIKEKCGINTMIVDANDIEQEILGCSKDLKLLTDQKLSKLIFDNPAGQDDECTPFIIIRDLKGREAEYHEPMVAIDKPKHH